MQPKTSIGMLHAKLHRHETVGNGYNSPFLSLPLAPHPPTMPLRSHAPNEDGTGFSRPINIAEQNYLLSQDPNIAKNFRAFLDTHECNEY